MWRWDLYALDGCLLGLFMISAASFATLLFHPGSEGSRAGSPGLRRGLMGVAMGATAAALIVSPLGRASGAHMNPAVTLAFLSLGTVSARDACGYIGGQTLGAVAGIALARALLGRALAHPAVAWVVTQPGAGRPARDAALAESLISFTQLFAVLLASNGAATHRHTPLIAGGLVAAWIVVAGPVSGMSMNPARTLASALAARRFRALWVYLLAPPAAMVAAAQAYALLDREVFCAKLRHDGAPAWAEPCPFRCRFAELSPTPDPAPAGGQHTTD
jgi:aquaporin Z